METQHLVLLMGTNPLPNYVAARYFLQHNSEPPTIWVVCSKETRESAERLDELLDVENYEYCDLTDPGDAAAIRQNVNDQILSNISSGDSVHLNYTGGTKSMVVQTFAAITKKIPGEKLSFSYLDADKYRLRFDDGDITSDLRKEISIGFDQLLRLHDCQKKSVGSEVDWSAANEIISSIIREKKLPDFMDWIYTVIHPNFYHKDKFKKPDKKFYKDWIRYNNQGNTIPCHREVESLLNQFPEKQRWNFDNQDALIVPDSTKHFFKGIRYLHGLWLEYYINNLLKTQIEKEKSDLKLFYDWHILKGAAEKDFQIDTMLLYGYQLCAISITTSNDEKLCKSKAFEILHRSRQMGGDEARAVLINTLQNDKVELMQDDLDLDVGSSDQLLILGLDDLQNNRVGRRIFEHVIGA